MAFAPQLGRLDPRSGYTDAITPGSDGTAHYESPETSRRVDVQLASMTRSGQGLDGVRATGGREVVAVRLRLAAARGGDIPGCRVELYSGDTKVSTPAPDLAACGTGAIGSAPREVFSTVHLLVPRGTGVSSVRVQWDPPAFVSLPAV